MRRNSKCLIRKAGCVDPGTEFPMEKLGFFGVLDSVKVFGK